MMSPDDSGSSSSDSKTPTPLHSGRESYFEDINQVSPSSKSQCISIPSSPASPGTATLRPRRSSLSLGLDQLRHAGGVNSIDAFARSWTRAAGYFEITPSRQSYVSVSDFGDDDDAERGESSILDDEVEPVPAEYTGYQPPTTYGSYGSIPSLHRGSYGSISSLPRGAMPSEGLSNSVVRHAEELFAEQQRAMMDPEAVDKEHEPLLVKTVATEEGIQQVIVGQSTLPQTVFNSVNVLIGVGLLSLPLGLKYSGWLIGMLFLAFSAVITNYTAKLLARCLERSPNQSLVTYSDIAFLAFGHKSRVAVSILFSLELVAACVALVVLFADSLNSLIPSISVTGWKIIAGIILTPLSFIPLQVLSFSSILGIFSTVSIFLIVLVNGLMKRNYPGSLLDPAPQYMFPQSWYTLPISFGLLMSPWGGHSVFPNIFRDMRHPHKYNRAVNITYWFTYLLDASMMVVGILMFGDGVMDEITQNLLELTEYPESTKLAMVIFVAIIPLTKTPLNARPIISTLEVLLGVDARAIAYQPGVVGMTSTTRSIFRIGIRVLVNATFVGIAIIFPAFDRIMAFLGSALCFSICVILPLLFYLKIFGNEVSKREKTFDLILVVICSILAVIGTAFTFIPQENFQ